MQSKTASADAQIPNESRAELLDAIDAWLINGAHGVWEEGMEVLRDIVARPDAHEHEIDHLLHFDMTWQDLADSIGNADMPCDWGYPADNWADVQYAVELQCEAGLSRMQALVWVQKDAGYTHNEICDRMGVKKPTVDEHSRRVRVKVNRARSLLNVIDD